MTPLARSPYTSIFLALSWPKQLCAGRTLNFFCTALTLHTESSASPAGCVSNVGYLPLELLFPERSLDGRSRGGWVIHLDHQPGVPLVLEMYHNGLFRSCIVPEHAR